MESAGLRQLARRYADGELDRDSYRQARTELLETVLKGNKPDPLTQANYTSPKAVTGEETITAKTFRNNQTVMLNRMSSSELLHQQTQPIKLTEESHWPRITLIAAVVGVLIAIGIAMLYA